MPESDSQRGGTGCDGFPGQVFRWEGVDVSHRVVPSGRGVAAALATAFLLLASRAQAQLTDRTEAPNVAGAGIAKSLEQEIGPGVGDVMTPGSSTFLIRRDTARAIRRGRQLFQRKFRVAQGVGLRTQDGDGDLNTVGALGAGLAESCSGDLAARRASAATSPRDPTVAMPRTSSGSA